MKYVLSFVLGMVIVLLIVNIVSERTIPDETAVATRVDGTSRVISSGLPEGRLLRNDDSIGKNDQIELQGNSRLELRLPDGSDVRLSENARFTVRKLQFEKRTGTLYFQALLHRGKLWAKMKKHVTPDSRAEVATSAAAITAQNAVYSLNAEEDSSTTISVYEGADLVLNAARNTAQAADRSGVLAGGQPISLQALQQVSVSAKEGVLQPGDFDPKATMNDWVRWNMQRDAREGLLSITVTPAAPTITRRASLQFTAVAHYPDNAEKEVTSFATWSTSAVNVANIDPSGHVARAELGTAVISAWIEDMNGSTELTVSRDILSIKVTPASGSLMNGAVLQFKAVGRFSDKTVRDVTSSVVWKSSNANIAFVDAGGRAVAGTMTGTAVITASLGTKRGSARLKVRRELISITIMPESAMIMAHETQRFGAIGSYSDGTTEDLTEEVDWETSDATVAEVDQALAGRVIGKNKPGNATITASFNEKSGSATITVNTADTLSTP